MAIGVNTHPPIEDDKPQTEATESERIKKITEDLISKKIAETMEATNKEVMGVLETRKKELAVMEANIDTKKKEVDGILLELEKQGQSYAAKTMTPDDKLKKECNDLLQNTGLSI